MALPVVLVGVAVAAVATAGDDGVRSAHYLRQLIFGPAGPGVTHQVHHRASPPAAGVPLIPLGTAGFTARALARSPVHGHRARPRRRGLLGSGGLPRRARQ